MISSRNISVVEEKRIITGLIVSTQFTKEILPVLQLDYFVNSYLKTIAGWCTGFFDEHKRAPYLHIKDIYESQTKLKETDSELIGELLTTLSEQYDENSINVGYLTTSAIDYFRKRELEILVNNVSVLKEKEDYSDAEEQIKKFTRVTSELDSGALINIGDIAQVSEIYKQRDDEDKNFFNMPGDLGRYLGNFKRGDVIGYYAPAKRGKTWTLVDHFKQGVLQKKKTLFWSIEMTKTEILPRIMKSFVPMVTEEGEYTYPAFDCVKNQTGECGDRLSPVIILDGEEAISDPNHVVCTKCKGFRNGPHEFVMAIYSTTIFREADDIFTVQNFLSGTKRAQGSSAMFNKYGRLSVHPKYSLTYDKMMRDIEVLDSKDGFIPDIFIIDYVDILDVGSKFDDYRAVDEAWKLMARMAGEFNVLVITATQANKEGHKAGVLDSTHQAGFYGKNQHVNLMCGLNQTPEEKEQGIIKYGISEARSQHFIPGVMCTVLQDLAAGQAYLDSFHDFG